MERRILQPEQIIVPGEYELGNESILKIYFKVFDRGHGRDLPPAIVVRADIANRKQRRKRLEQRIEMFERLAYSEGLVQYYESLKKDVRQDYIRFIHLIQETPFYLLDGNHKTTAATLTHNLIYALELQSSKDIGELQRMVERGELFDFKRTEICLMELVTAFEEYCLGSVNAIGRGEMDNVRTVRQRIDELIYNGDLPQYMKDRYLRGK